MSFLNYILKYKSVLNFTLLVISAIYLLYLFAKIDAKDSEIQTLKLDIANSKFELLKCDKTLQTQNAAIKNLELKKPFEPPNTSKIEKVFVKDKSCESELKAYKELFR
ncbi:MAG: hypothetical protein MR902_07590 [Campylobacter sp.]|nr:hypothetical protein [Campylobacter sp.]